MGCRCNGKQSEALDEASNASLAWRTSQINGSWGHDILIAWAIDMPAQEQATHRTGVRREVLGRGRPACPKCPSFAVHRDFQPTKRHCKDLIPVYGNVHIGRRHYEDQNRH